MKDLLVQYRTANLEELQQMITDAVQTASVCAGRKVNAYEITFQCDKFPAVHACLTEAKLSDGSTVYDVEVSL